MTDDEVPPALRAVIGHVCGVVAVGMAALSAFFIWALVQPVLVATPGARVDLAVGLTVLFFRWAGALTGYWNTRGRLAVPKMVYAFLGAAFVASASSVCTS